MKKITFDTGLERVSIGSGVLYYNPQDPNLYARFDQAAEKLQAVEQDMMKKAEAKEGGELVQILKETDRKMKDILNWVFGAGNDFDAIVGGVNLLAVAGNGQRVVTNLFAALEPVLVDGAMACAKKRADQAAKQANARRAAQ